MWALKNAVPLDIFSDCFVCHCKVVNTELLTSENILKETKTLLLWLHVYVYMKS